MGSKTLSYDSNYQEKDIVDFPVGTKGVPNRQQKRGRFSLKEEDISLPCAVIRREAIDNNLKWMQTFAAHHNVKLCPHGKTTMSPDLFQRQLGEGAWGLTVASPAQAEVAAMAGAKHIIIANQVVGKANMQMVASIIKQYGAMVYCCVDSISNVLSWQNMADREDVTVPLFIEVGVKGGRCGCRNEEEIYALAKAIGSATRLSLMGLEVYEGVISGDNAEHNIRVFLQKAISVLETLKSTYAIPEAIISGAGSAWYDVVAEEFSHLDGIIGVIRPGCYAIHDTGIYEHAQHQVQARSHLNQGVACSLTSDLMSALEVWAYVISVPENGMAIVGLGKRDVAFDAGLPKIERVIRAGKTCVLSVLTPTQIMDQHMFVSVPDNDVNVGDILVMSTSHPCLTFDKWRYVGVVDQHDCITHWIPTYF